MEAEAQRKGGDVQAVVLIEVQQVFMHRLLNKDKFLFTSGTLRVAKLQNREENPVHFINLNSFYYGIQPNSFFIKIMYPDTVSYVFPHFENGLSAISVPTKPEFILAFDEVVKKVAHLYEYKDSQEILQIKELVQQHYPTMETQQIHNPDGIKKVIAGTGNVLNHIFTTVGGYLKTGVQKAGGFIQGKISEGEPTQLSQSTKTRWQNVKQGTSNFMTVSNEYVHKYLSPVVNKAKQYTNQIGNKINQSNNSTVKYAKEIAVVSGKAVGDAVDGIVKGGSEVVKEVGDQSKKIINKKYGPDVINTFAGQSQKKEEKVEKEREEVEKKGELKEQEGDSEVRLKDVSSQNLYPQLQK